MNLSKLRMSIATVWIAFWILATILVLLACVVRHDHAIGFQQVPDALIRISGIWLPPLSAFAAFWFKQPGRTKLTPTVDKERSIAAIFLTLVYAVLSIALICVPLFFAPYHKNEASNLDPGTSFSELLGDDVKYLLLISALVLGPVAWLTGEPVKSTTPKVTKSSRPADSSSASGDPAAQQRGEVGNLEAGADTGCESRSTE
jgi:hypothetical protein